MSTAHAHRFEALCGWGGARLRGWLARDPLVATLVGCGVVVLLTATASQGFVRDEGYYFRAAAEYHAWFEGLWQNLWAGRLSESFSSATLSRDFGYNWEHPGFVKIFQGWTWKIFHVWLGLVSSATGYRLAAIIMVAVGAAFTYLFGARLASRGVGLLGVALFLACPHVFFHAHLACFDGPITAMTVVVTYAFWRSLSSRGWILGAGVAWGIAIATKHNAVFLLPTLLLAYWIAKLPELRVEKGGRLTLPGIPLAVFAMLLLGPVIFLACYPYGWPNPIGRIAAYYYYHLHHEHYPVDYFGTLYVAPPFPWHFPFVMSAITVPLTVLVTGLCGWGLWLGAGVAAVWRGVRRQASGGRPAVDGWLVVVSTLVPPAIIAVPSVPIFGGTKHWMPMMPFFCLLAAWVILRAAADLRARWPRLGGAFAVTLVAAALVLPAVETARTHPFGHTYFNELVGGHQGGAALGMPRTFWGGDGRALLPLLNEQASRGATLFTHRMNWDDFRAYQENGLLRDDIRFASDLRHADWALAYHQREYQDAEYQVWALTGDRRPVGVVAYDGVPIVSLYRLRPPATGKGGP